MRWWLYAAYTLLCIKWTNAAIQRWKGTDGRYLSASCDKTWQPATITQCIAMCKREGCVAFSIQKRIEKCCISTSGTTYVTSSDIKNVHYLPTSVVNEPRSPAVQTPGVPPSFCPVVFREDWQKFYKNTTSGKWGLDQISMQSALDNMFDDDPSTTGGTMSAANSWISIDFKKPFRLTSLWITAGATPIKQLDIRMGNTQISGTEYFTSNERCNSFMGQTRAENERLFLTCSKPRGVYGQYLSIQHISQDSNPLLIAELTIQGFARVCDSTADF